MHIIGNMFFFTVLKIKYKAYLNVYVVFSGHSDIRTFLKHVCHEYIMVNKGTNWGHNGFNGS